VSAPDLAIRNVRIIDGTGSAPVDGDVEIDRGRITAVGAGVRAARREIDGGGLVISPGFVDTHTHDDGALLVHPGLEFKLSQGCTSLVIGNCGFSAIPASAGETPPGGLFGGLRAEWEDLEGYRRAVDSVHPACNAMALIGHNAMRMAALGSQRREPTRAELTTMQGWVSRAMEQGACGMSTGLVYVPGRYSRTDEIVALATVLAPFNGIYATHMRDEGDRLLDSVEETIRIGREASVPVHISHHKAAGKPNWGKVVDSLARIDEANGAGSDISLDVYPYTAGSGPMIAYFNLDDISTELAEVIRLASCPAFPEFEGRMLIDVATAEGVPIDEMVRRILTAPRGDRTISIQFMIDEADVETNLRHPGMMIGSDGIPDLTGQPHPRLFGTFPRVLGNYVRVRNVISLEEAIRRMTSLSCQRFGLTDRGEIREGWWADLVVFDPETITDSATYDDPMREAAGVALVVVNGQVAYDQGRHTGVGAGRVLHYGSAEGLR
jgi:N-acyl-D-amino-acid deacylase